MADNEWHHAAWVYDGQTLQLYIDGKLKRHDAMTGKNACLSVGEPASNRVNVNMWRRGNKYGDENKYGLFKHRKYSFKALYSIKVKLSVPHLFIWLQNIIS